MVLSCSCDDPVDAVFFRTVAWEIAVAKNQFERRGRLYEHLQAARRELGLKPLIGGALSEYVSDRIRDKSLTENFEPYNKIWQSEWRIINIPPHSAVRELSLNPVTEPVDNNSKYKEFSITFRHPAVSKVSVFIGKDAPDPKVFAIKRGVYILRLEQSLYIGKSDEFNVRFPQHLSKEPIWWIFTVPENDPDFGKDEQEATEALLISFWNEIAQVYNNNRGTEWEPSYPRMQKAILLTMAVSATFIWLIQKYKDNPLLEVHENYWKIPYKPSGKQGWPECYLHPLNTGDTVAKA